MARIVSMESIIVSVPAEGNAFAESAEETVVLKLPMKTGCTALASAWQRPT